jgi:hypothetical protein
MRLRLFVLAALVALAVPTSAVARTAKGHHQHGDRQREASIVGTWEVRVTVDGQAPFPALLTFTRGGGVVETESDQPVTGLGSWKRISDNQFAVAFKSFLFTETGAPGGSVLTRSTVTFDGDTLSGPFKFDVSDPTGKVMQSGSGTATATRFVIPAL